VLKISKFEDLLTKICVDIEGCLGHLQAYGFTNSWIHVDLVLDSFPPKNFTTKLLPLFVRRVNHQRIIDINLVIKRTSK
jgi:hypothetical protein